MKKRVAVLGSTGSIGLGALDVISSLPEDFEVTAIAANSNIKMLAKQAARFRPGYVCIGDAALQAEAERSFGNKIRLLYGKDGLARIAGDRGIDLVVFAVSGCECIGALIAAVKSGKRIALANKESLVSMGELVIKLAGEHGAEILPVDSEHSAIFQCLEGRDRGSVRRVYLTGSGGPLLNVPVSRFNKLSKDFILKHPRWRMGRKISIDSATMMNKALEIIEAKVLFGLEADRIEVLIHPEAIIHSMVEFKDGAIMAQLGEPDMRLPIQYAMTYPARAASPVKPVNFSRSNNFTFFKPDHERFPCLKLGYAAAKKGRTYPAVLCAADEVAVASFLEGRIRFSDIHMVIEKVLSRHEPGAAVSISAVMAAIDWAKKEARSICYR